MGQPDGTTVNYDALINDAKKWEEEQQKLHAVNGKIQALHLDLIQLGQFYSAIYNPYNSLTERLAKAAEQGATAAGHIAQSLRATVEKYKGTDHGSAHNIQSVPHIEIPHF